MDIMLNYYCLYIPNYGYLGFKECFKVKFDSGSFPHL